MKNRRILLAGCVLVLAAVVQAGTVVMTANIPFEFSVGGKVLSAGEYRIITEPNARNSLAVIGKGGSSHVLTLSFGEYCGGPREARLIFNRFGDQYFLHKLESPAFGQQMEIPASTKERELRKTAAVKKELVILALR